MKLNLDTLKTEIEGHLQAGGFVIYPGHSRHPAEERVVEWDTERFQEFRDFLETAKQLEVRLVVFHYRQFDSGAIDDAIENIEEAGLEYEHQKLLEKNLRELSAFDGFTCALELSFDYQGMTYLFALETEWYREMEDILDEIELLAAPGGEEATEDDESLGGYYSKN